ncbi:hypothetical protein [Rhizobium sp. CF142]|uniref:hypothetical protein n=1 Tax=Rhizobium sp. CF142 TaxID=1144314 RepID=UPI00026EF688|nr:hypothetical protein [Rhizobium sp. CF142]EJJ27679.1 hypothetical protein PMI11_04080 [Rhizobium sp. CF142]
MLARKSSGQKGHDIDSITRKHGDVRMVLEHSCGGISGFRLDHEMAAEWIDGCGDAVPGYARRLAHPDLAQLQFGSPPECHFANRTGHFRRSPRSPPLPDGSRTVRFPWILISVSSTSTPSVTTKDDGSMEVEVAWTYLPPRVDSLSVEQ